MPGMDARKIKAKGRYAETRLVDYLSQFWPLAERRRQSGIQDKGDISGIPKVVVEVKNEKTFKLAGWVDELNVEIQNARAESGAVVFPRKGRGVEQWYALVPLELWVQDQLKINRS